MVNAAPLAGEAIDLALSKPVLALKVIDFGKLPFIGSDEREPKGESLGGDQQIVTPKRLAFLFETGAENTVHAVSRLLERQNLDGSEDGLNLSRETCRSLLGGAVPQFGGDDDAGRYLSFTDISDVCRHAALRTADHLGDDIGIEQVAHQT